MFRLYSSKQDTWINLPLGFVFCLKMRTCFVLTRFQIIPSISLYSKLDNLGQAAMLQNLTIMILSMPTSPDLTTQRHYNNVILNTMASQITSPTIVYSTVYSGADQRKHQSSASLALVLGIHRWIQTHRPMLVDFMLAKQSLITDNVGLAEPNVCKY